MKPSLKHISAFVVSLTCTAEASGSKLKATISNIVTVMCGWQGAMRGAIMCALNFFAPFFFQEKKGEGIKVSSLFALILILSITSFSASAQTTYADTTKFKPVKNGAGNELLIESSTKHIKGFILNYDGAGNTKFKVGIDTMYNTGNTLYWKFTNSATVYSKSFADSNGTTIDTVYAIIINSDTIYSIIIRTDSVFTTITTSDTIYSQTSRVDTLVVLDKFVVPFKDTADAVPSIEKGDIRLQPSNSTFYGFNGTNWVDLSGSYVDTLYYNSGTLYWHYNNDQSLHSALITTDTTSSSGDCAAVDSLWRTPGIDSIYFSIDGAVYSIKDSTGGGGSGISEVVADYGLININDSTIKVDSATLAEYFMRRVDSTAGGYYPYSSNPLNYLTSDNSEIQWSVINIQTTPPGSPTLGDKYLVAFGGTGAWSGLDNKIVEWNGSSWDASTATSGDLLQNNSNSINYRFNGAIWSQTGLSPALITGNGTIGITGNPYTIGNRSNNTFSIITNNIARLAIAGSGAVTLSNLAGSGSTLTKVSATGLFSRATAGTDYQAALTGTGFVKSTAGTISYDNSTYTATSRTLNVTSPITGGGDLSADRTFGLDTTTAGGGWHSTGYYDTRYAAAGLGVPAGSNTQLQYNNSGAFGASSNLTYGSSVFTFTRDAIGATTIAPSFYIQNTTAATGTGTTAQSWSPTLVIGGQGWKTASTAGSQSSQWYITNKPVSGTNQPDAKLYFDAYGNGSLISNILTLSSVGNAAIVNGVMQSTTVNTTGTSVIPGIYGDGSGAAAVTVNAGYQFQVGTNGGLEIATPNRLTGTGGARLYTKGNIRLVGGMTSEHIANPSISTVTKIGSAGAVTYGYKVVVKDRNNQVTAASSEVTISTSVTTLNGSNYNVITLSNVVDGACQYLLYRTTAGGSGNSGTTGLIYTTNFNFNSSPITLTDQGAAGDGTTPSAENTTGGISILSSTANSSLQVNGSFSTVLVAKTANYTATYTDNTIDVDATSGAVTITLPAITGITGREYVISKNDASGNAVTVSSASNINGSGTYSLSSQYKYVRVKAAISEWRVVGNN